MKIRYLSSIALLLLATSLVYISMMVIPVEQSKNEGVNTPKFAVVELFTSEGCSSCPAADELLGGLYSEYHEKNLSVYFLSFHVDYWNYLGWKDDFSRKEFTQRQYRYGETFDLQSVYTPQMIVNGTTEFVGSNRIRLESAVKSALSTQSEVHIDLKGCLVLNDSTIKVVYTIDRFPADMILNFAIVEHGLVREIKRGENSGKTLHHHNVVRAFQSTSDKDQSEMVLEIPSGIIIDNASLIVFAQNQSTMKILAASGLEIKVKQ